MNYLRHYIKLVKRAKQRVTVDNKIEYEKHHVFPVSIYGKNNFWVYLTLREHYIAHELLWKALKKRYGVKDDRTRKMAMAFHCMIYGKGDTHRKEKYDNSRLYHSARTAVSESKKGKIRKDMLGKAYFGASEETIRNSIEKMRAKKIGMKIDYPKNRKSSPCSVEKAKKISKSRTNTKQKYIEMSDQEFNNWVKTINPFRKDGRVNPNLTRALKWREDASKFNR